MRATWIAFLLVALVACGGPTATSSGGATTDVTGDLAATLDAAPDTATGTDVADASDAATDAFSPDGADDSAGTDAVVTTDVLSDATDDASAQSDVDDASDAAATDATQGEDAQSDAALADAADPDAVDATVPDAVEADSAALDVAADADVAVADVDAGPTPLGLNADVTLTAPYEGQIVNVGETLTVSYALDVVPAAGAWVVTVSLGADPTAVQAFDALPQQYALQLPVLSAGKQLLTLRLWQDDVLVAVTSVTVIGNLPPTGTPQVVIPPTTVQTDLQANLVQPSVDPEGAPLTWSWLWLLDGKPTTFVTPTVPKQWLKRGQKWSVVASASDGHASGPMGTAEVIIANSVPTAVELESAATSVPLTGEATATILTASTDADGDTLTLKFVWTWQGNVVGAAPTLSVPTALANGAHLTPGALQLAVIVSDGAGGEATTELVYSIVVAPVCGTSWWVCSPHANCVDDGTLTPPCTCQGGWLGDGKSCTDNNECAANPCDPNAMCVNSPGSFSCSCLTGFTGNGFSCTDIDECAGKGPKCGKFATCANTPGSYTCTCIAGYTGDGTLCTDIDECAQNLDNCDANATCDNTAGSFQCTCNAGWQGSGLTCADINECSDPALNLCDSHATCINGDGGYDCVCQAGWSGTGLSCSDVDECALGTANCDIHASCSNTIGSFTCTCAAGFTGPGTACTDINECSDGSATCDPNATCGNTDGSYICACNAGYAGSGKTCTSVCDLYCSTVMSNCTGGNQQYASLAACQQTCTTGGAWALGQVGDSSGDSVYCRYAQANSAALAPTSFCAAAGPTGGNTCGTWCDGYCDLMQHNCAGTYASTSACQTACAAFPTTGSVGATTGNSLQCRDNYALSAAGCAYAGVTSSKCSAAMDITGWKIEQAGSTQSYTMPTATVVASGGYLILARAATKAEFETFWGVTLGANVTYIQSALLANASSSACPQINGDETYTLRRADSSVADGPTVPMTANGKFIFNRTDPTQASNNALAWTAADYNIKANATPGSGATPGKVNGLYISEFADAAGTNNFIYEYAEVYLDPGP